MLLDSRFQQTLQNGPFPHGGGKVEPLAGESGVGALVPVLRTSLRRPCFWFVFVFFVGRDYIEAPLVPLTSTLRPGFSSLRLSVCVEGGGRGGVSTDPGPVPFCLFSQARRGTELITSPTSCAVMLVLPPSAPLCAAIQHML